MSTGPPSDPPPWQAPGSESTAGWSAPAYPVPPQGSAWGGAPRPGIIPLRPLGLGEILDGAFTLIRRYPRVTLGVSATVATINASLFLVVELATTSYPSSAGASGPDFGAGLGGGISATAIVATLIINILSAVLGAVVTGMLTIVVGDAVLGRDVSIGTVWDRLHGRLLRLLGISFLAAFLPILALVACIIPGVFLWGAYALAVPAFVLERTGVIAALRRSYALAVPTWWRVWGIRALGYLMVGIVSSILSLPFVIAGLASSGLLSGNDITGTPVLYVVLAALGTLVAQTVTAPLMSGILALLYVDRRMRAEGLDVALAASAVGPAPT